MGKERGMADSAFVAPVLSVGMTCRTNKIRGQNTKKMSPKKRWNSCLKTPGMHEISSFFQNYSKTVP